MQRYPKRRNFAFSALFCSCLGFDALEGRCKGMKWPNLLWVNSIKLCKLRYSSIYYRTYQVLRTFFPVKKRWSLTFKSIYFSNFNVKQFKLCSFYICSPVNLTNLFAKVGEQVYNKYLGWTQKTFYKVNWGGHLININKASDDKFMRQLVSFLQELAS